jgi:hypothetical protein
MTIAEQLLDRSLTISEFCQKKRMSRAHFYNLRQIGRAPCITQTGGVHTISPESEAEWDRDIVANPIVEGVRKLAEKARSSTQAA